MTVLQTERLDAEVRRPPEELAQLQSERLVSMVRYAYERSPFYRDSFDALSLQPGDIKSIADLSKLPFTYKGDIAQRFPWGLCAVDPREIVRLHSSSGSTGNPVNTFYTRRDLDTWADCLARLLSMTGVTPDDVCQVAFRYTLFTGAFGHHLGAERLGALVVPTSSGQTERQISMMQAMGTTVLHCTPSYALVIAETMADMRVEPSSLALRLGIHGAEAMTDGMRDELVRRLGYRVARDYGLTEFGGPGVSMECEARNGYHVNEDHFYPEIIDPATGQTLPDGEVGELVLTSLSKEGAPVLRYRTRDLTSLTREPCEHGHTLVRHGLIVGRTDDMLIVGGVNFFPTQVERVLLSFEELAPHYLIRVFHKDRRDRVCVDVELQPECWAVREADGLAQLREVVCHQVKEAVGFRADVQFLQPCSLPRSEGKTKRVQDDR
jgi:phenylacetate-CoA ligase